MHGQVPEPRPFTALRIFLSYGHDANEELVRRIKADLEQRGHDVWFDKAQIKAGDDWRRAITDGILHSQRVVSFLSKHSTRDPGVCRDEIAIAIGVKGGNIQTILVESEAEVQPPVNIGHIQWLDMHDWQQQRAGGAVAWERWYEGKFAEIVRVVESDQSRRFAGEIETLHGRLKPIRSEARIYDLLKKGFFGRQWLFESIESWRNSPAHNSRLFWITGDPGVGKSAFAAQLIHTRSDAVIAGQFVEWDKPDHRDARRVVRSLAFQLATRLPDYRKLLLTLPEIAELDRKDPAELFDHLLANPLRSVIDGGRERQLIVIDALDEAGEAGRNPLVELLARHAPRLPDWLGLVVTSRPESAVQTPLQGLNPFVLDTRTEANCADLRDYLRRQLAPQLHDRPDADRLVGQILEKSEGVFLYVERFCDDVQQNHFSLDRPEQFPQGLGGIFCQWFQRQFADLDKFRKDVCPALRAILAAREPLPVEILQRLFKWRDEELRDFTRTLGSLFPVTKEANGEVIKTYHKSLADWLGVDVKAGVHFVSASEGHRLISDYGYSEFQREPGQLSDYFVTNLPHHLLEVSRWSDGALVLAEPTEIERLADRDSHEMLMCWRRIVKHDATLFRNSFRDVLEKALRLNAAYVQCHAESNDANRTALASALSAMHHFGTRLATLGWLHTKLNFHRDALLLYLGDGLVGRAGGDNRRYARALISMGGVLRELGDIEGAAKSFEEAEIVARGENDEDTLQSAIMHKGLVSTTAEAFEHYAKAESICRETGNDLGLAYALFNQAGHLFMVQRRYADALAPLKECIPIFEHYKEREMVAHAREMFELAEIALGRARPSEAKSPTRKEN